MPGRSLEETLEVMVRRELGQARDTAGDIAGRYLGLENPAVILAKSGARGSMLNLTQMAGAVGQQSVRGERLHARLRPPDAPALRAGRPRRRCARVRQLELQERALADGVLLPLDGRPGVARRHRRPDEPVRLHAAAARSTPSRTSRSPRTGPSATPPGRSSSTSYGEDGIDPTRSYQGARGPARRGRRAGPGPARARERRAAARRRRRRARR